MSIQKER